MPDWRALTAEQLAGLRLPEARREEVVQELSEHLEDDFAVLRQSLPEDEAQRRALELLAERNLLIREIRKAEQEDPMTQSARIFLCGIVTGAVLFLLPMFVVVFLGGKLSAVGLFAAAEAGSGPQFSGPFNGLLHFAAGVWTIWFYSVLRSSYGSGTKTAALAGFALWLIGVLAAASWTSLGFLPPNVLQTAAVIGLPAWIVAAVAGAWPYELSERKPSQALKAS